jgi:hypothetical protein
VEEIGVEAWRSREPMRSSTTSPTTTARHASLTSKTSASVSSASCSFAELLVPSVGRAWALLRAPNLAASFRGLNAELVVVLPSASLHISNDGTAQYHDPDEAVCPVAVGLSAFSV